MAKQVEPHPRYDLVGIVLEDDLDRVRLWANTSVPVGIDDDCRLNPLIDVVGTGGVGVGVSVGIGGTNPTNPSNPNPSTLGNVSTPISPSNPGTVARRNLTSVVADMSDGKVARLKKRCADVLGNDDSYDRDLRQLCLLIARR